jgi:hypothetical protein
LSRACFREPQPQTVLADGGPHAAKMNGVKLESPLGRTPSSGGSSTIFASPVPPVYSHPHYFVDTGPAAVNGADRLHIRHPDSHGDADDIIYSPGVIKPVSRHGHHRTESHGGSSVVSAGPGTRSASDRDGSTASPSADGQPQKKKQKRNKPTLSCFECVERKTKACLVPFR